jgi:hypothetical protein
MHGVARLRANAHEHSPVVLRHAGMPSRSSGRGRPRSIAFGELPRHRSACGDARRHSCMPQHTITAKERSRRRRLSEQAPKVLAWPPGGARNRWEPIRGYPALALAAQPNLRARACAGQTHISDEVVLRHERRLRRVSPQTFRGRGQATEPSFMPQHPYCMSMCACPAPAAMELRRPWKP